MTSNNEKKLKELAKYLEVPVSEIQIEDEDSKDKYNRYLTANGSYYVMDEDEAYEAAKEDIESIVKDFKKLLIKINAKNFEEKSKNLFIMDSLNIKSYEDFCDKYDILKKRQKDLLDLEKEIDEYFDEE